MQIWKLLNSWADRLQGCVCGYLLVLYLLQEYKNSYTNHLQRWVLPAGEHISLPLGTPIKHLSRSPLKNPSLKCYCNTYCIFYSPQIFLTPRFLEC